MTTSKIRILGFAPASGEVDLARALNATAGPEIRMCAHPEIIAVLQAEPAGSWFTRGRDAILENLHIVQRRLEAACSAGPFLPMDPAAACANAELITSMLHRATHDDANPVQAALAAHGSTQQWDVILKWAPEPIVARARATLAAAAQANGRAGLAEAVGGVLRDERTLRSDALVKCLTPVVIRIGPDGTSGGDTEIAVTICLQAGGEGSVEAALSRLDEDASWEATLDMRGPLPPISFAAVKIVDTPPDDIEAAWRRLALPREITRQALHRHWRHTAANAHPDRQAHAPEMAAEHISFAEINTSYQLIRSLMAPGPDQADDSLYSLKLLMRHAGPRLVLPATATATATHPHRAELVS